MKKLTKEKFVAKANKVHNNKYDYSKFEYKNSIIKSVIICPIHGEFKKKPSTHLFLAQGCPSCISSKGEDKIEKWLKNNSFNYIKEKRFKGCKDKNELRFDFYLPNYNLCIEYDGQQHFKPLKSICRGSFSIEQANKKFNYIQRHDKLKDDYCKSNNIELIRIHYIYFNKIEEILKKRFKI